MLRVLLVCTGNICRSPMAQGFLFARSRHALGEPLEVRSAGTWAQEGDPPTPEAVAVAGERGVPIEDLRSTPVTATLVEGADLVLTMTTEQADEVLAEVPEAADRTFTLKEIVALLAHLPPPEGAPTHDALVERVEAADRLRTSGQVPFPSDPDVADPLGLGLPSYRAVAAEIEDLVDGLVAGLAAVPRTARAGGGA